MNKFLVGIVVVVGIGMIGILAGIIGYFYGQKNQSLDNGGYFKNIIPVSTNDRKRDCPQDLMECLDGSMTGRVGINCEFEPCAVVDNKASSLINTEGEINSKGVKEGVSKTVSIDSVWNQYTNYENKFTIKVPKRTSSDGEKYHNVKIIEAGAITYLTSWSDDEEYIKEARKGKTVFEKTYGVSFAILVQKVANEKELEKFIQSQYAKNCKLGNIEETNKKGLFNVKIDSGDEELDFENLKEDDCFINYMTVIKYSPKKGLVASWDIGQAVNFMVAGKATMNDKAYDSIISESFEFID